MNMDEVMNMDARIELLRFKYQMIMNALLTTEGKSLHYSGENVCFDNSREISTLLKVLEPERYERLFTALKESKK